MATVNWEKENSVAVLNLHKCHIPDSSNLHLLDTLSCRAEPTLSDL